MNEEERRSVSFRRIGGFSPFPFFPSKLSIGGFQIIWRHWMLFETFEVRHQGSLFLETKIDGTIVSQKGVEGYFRESISKGIEGVRIRAEYAGAEFIVECRSENPGLQNERLAFSVLEGQSRIGFFSWPKENGEVIAGQTFEDKSHCLWFWGMSLMKLWGKERERQMAGYS